MSLRTQKVGGPKNKEVWKIEDIKDGLENFYKKYERYPTAQEIDGYPHLPSARTIERRFGGLIAIRKRLNLNGQSDFRIGEHSSKRANIIIKRAHKTEQIVHQYLQNIFGKEFVHREYFFTDDKRTRADFFVFDSDKGFCIDVFYPNSIRNLTGCLNNKLNKYLGEYTRQYPVIYLQMNNSIEQDELDEIVKNKIRKLPSGQYLMSWSTFKDFCNNKTPL